MPSYRRIQNDRYHEFDSADERCTVETMSPDVADRISKLGGIDSVARMASDPRIVALAEDKILADHLSKVDLEVVMTFAKAALTGDGDDWASYTQAVQKQRQTFRNMVFPEDVARIFEIFCPVDFYIPETLRSEFRQLSTDKGMELALWAGYNVLRYYKGPDGKILLDLLDAVRDKKNDRYELFAKAKMAHIPGFNDHRVRDVVIDVDRALLYLSRGDMINFENHVHWAVSGFGFTAPKDRANPHAWLNEYIEFRKTL